MHLKGYFIYSFSAIIIWSTLAILGFYTKNVPSLQLLAIALTTSGLSSLVIIKEFNVPLKTLLIGVGGIFGYHYFIFTSYKFAPIVEANLLNYLWPLLIVFLSPVLLKKYKLRSHHIVGTLLGFTGAFLIFTGGRISFDFKYLPGYLLATIAAIIWSLYSLMMKRIEHFPTSVIGLFCLISGVLSFIIMFITGQSFYYPSSTEWVSMILLGVGPMGLAFFLWDKALKEGDPRIVGSLSYLTPFVSTLWLVILGGLELNLISSLAMILLVFGSLIGSKDLIIGAKTLPLDE
jgi:drug/metabolite transporter (DMT)-like permease